MPPWLPWSLITIKNSNDKEKKTAFISVTPNLRSKSYDSVLHEHKKLHRAGVVFHHETGMFVK